MAIGIYSPMQTKDWAFQISALIFFIPKLSLADHPDCEVFRHFYSQVLAPWLSMDPDFIDCCTIRLRRTFDIPLIDCDDDLKVTAINLSSFSSSVNFGFPTEFESLDRYITLV